MTYRVELETGNIVIFIGTKTVNLIIKNGVTTIESSNKSTIEWFLENRVLKDNPSKDHIKKVGETSFHLATTYKTLATLKNALLHKTPIRDVSSTIRNQTEKIVKILRNI